MKRNRRKSGAIGYFHRNIEKFDSIYADDKGPAASFLNKTLRASVKARFDLAFDILGDLTRKSVLDIGCGSGRYMFKAVERNAEYVVGVDAAAGALEKARQIAADLNIENKIKFIENDFMDCSFDRKFDVIFAVGYFDYIFNPSDHLKKMVDLSNGVVYASFPKLWSVLTITRKIRLMLNRCPVSFYSRSRIKKLLRETGIDNYEIKRIFRDNILIVRK